MSIYMTYGIIFIILLALELVYFRVADRFNIIDKPNERSSHSHVVLRGGGIIFLIAAWVWSALYGFQYPWFLIGLTLIGGVSFYDDIHSLPDSVRLVIQFVAMILMAVELGVMQWSMWWIVIIALIVAVGMINIYNFMDGINGITGGYALAVLMPLAYINANSNFIEPSFLYTVIIALLVFCIFNFRPKGKAKCFAGDVGSISIAMIIVLAIGSLVLKTGDVTYMIVTILYGVDGCLTICHRIMLHENLGEAHRKHAFQIMANELQMGHVKVTLIYMAIQLAITAGFLYAIPNTLAAHWIYLLSVLVVLAVAYVLFMKKYYHLHEEYLKSLEE